MIAPASWFDTLESLCMLVVSAIIGETGREDLVGEEMRFIARTYDLYGPSDHRPVVTMYRLANLGV